MTQHIFVFFLRLHWIKHILLVCFSYFYDKYAIQLFFPSRLNTNIIPTSCHEAMVLRLFPSRDNARMNKQRKFYGCVSCFVFYSTCRFSQLLDLVMSLRQIFCKISLAKWSDMCVRELRIFIAFCAAAFLSRVSFRRIYVMQTR